MRTTASWLALGMAMAAFSAFGVAQVGPSGATSLNAIVEALEKARAGIHPNASYQVIREYRLFRSNNSTADSDVVAQVDFKPPSGKQYRITSWTGSNRGPQVVRRVLEHEVQA